MSAIQRIAALDIAVTRLRVRGRNAEGDHPVLLRQRRGGAGGGDEGIGIGDVMVAGTDQHHRICRQQRGGQRDGGGGVLRLRLHHDARIPRFAQLRFDMVQMRRAGDHDGRGKGLARAATGQCAFEQRLLADQR